MQRELQVQVFSLCLYFSKSQQYKMAKYCEDIFGELLLKSPLPECPVSWPFKFEWSCEKTCSHVFLYQVMHTLRKLLDA